MKRINYPVGGDLEQLKHEYIEAFSNISSQREAQWKEFKSKHPRKYKGFPDKWGDFLTADFSTLLDIYKLYLQCESTFTNKERKSIKRMFGYQSYVDKNTQADSVIGSFFIRHATELDIYTCHYCDMSYINLYNLKNKPGNITTKRSFDLDHVIPQKECPMLSISMYNFVPSCKVCNQTVKHDGLLGGGDIGKMLRYSPSSNKFSVDRRVIVGIKMKGSYKSGFMRHKDNFRIKFRSSDFYRGYVEDFHLEERYEFHKDEALRLLDLRRVYPKRNIQQIAKLLKKTESEVYEDIFGERFTIESHRCFSKLKRDIMDM